MSLTHGLRRLLWKMGYDVAPFEPTSHALSRRRRLFQSLEVDVVLDVGANEGQFARELRRDVGYGGQICSFEPTSDAYRALVTNAARDPNWHVFNLALGDHQGRATMNLAANSESSSMLRVHPAHVEAAPQSRFVGTEDVDVEMLDSIFGELCAPGERVYLKIDAQGFEIRVLRGADRSLALVETVQLEMPLQPSYDGEASFDELHHLLVAKGYTMIGLEAAFVNPRDGRVLQVDGVFHREGEAAT